MIDQATAAPAGNPGEIILSREQMLTDLLSWCSNFIDRSAEWRKNSFESDWASWSRNSDAIYDPVISAKKEAHQSRAFWPLTPSHRENAQANLFQIELGAKPPLEYEPRVEPMAPQQMPGMPAPVDQGQLVRDLVLLEREKAEYETERNKQNEDRSTYGSGFMRARFETKTEPRVVQVPVYENAMSSMGAAFRSLAGQPQIIGYEPKVQEVVVYRGVRLEQISIWDVFPDPKALQVKGHPIAHRYYTTYGEIVDGAQERIDESTGQRVPGWVLPEAVDKLKTTSDEVTPEDKKVVETDRKIADSQVPRPDYGRNIECFELQARLPKKWVLINGEDIDDPEALMPARVRIKKGLCVISVEPSDTYDGEPDIDKDDYMPVAGRFYGRGVPEMLKDAQLVANEVINQRLDEGGELLATKYAVLEKFLADPKDIEENRKAIRFRIPPGHNIDDVRKAFARIEKGDVGRSSLIEPQEWERISQDRTSITRATLGTSEQVADSNRTLGGQQIQQGVTQDKMTFLAKLSEYGFQKRLSHRIWALIYQNYQPEDYVLALGPEKASQLQLMSPEQIAQNYRLIPKGVFEAEHKQTRDMALAAIQQQYGMQPWLNSLGICKTRLAGVGVDESIAILPEAEALQIMAKAQEIGAGMAEQEVKRREDEDLAKKADLGRKSEGKK